MTAVERWPPAYDAAEVVQQIKDLAARGELFKKFYSNTASPVPFCQGDIVRLPAEFPHIAADGSAAVLEETSYTYWLLLTNTCDLHRSMTSVRWAQLVPMTELRDLTDVERLTFQRYNYSRQFFLPPWSPDSLVGFAADFTSPVTIERIALVGLAKVEARLDYPGWALLSACLLRFLARDDGRFD